MPVLPSVNPPGPTSFQLRHTKSWSPTAAFTTSTRMTTIAGASTSFTADSTGRPTLASHVALSRILSCKWGSSPCRATVRPRVMWPKSIVTCMLRKWSFLGNTYVFFFLPLSPKTCEHSPPHPHAACSGSLTLTTAMRTTVAYGVTFITSLTR